MMMRACAPGGDRFADLGQVQVHRKGIAPWQNQPGAGTARRADRAKDAGPFRALIVRRNGACAAPGQANLYLPQLRNDLFRLGSLVLISTP